MFTVTTRSTHPVTHVVFDPCLNTFAVAQPNYGVTLIERGTNRETAVLSNPRVGAFTSVIFCDGGTRVATSSNKGIHVFDVQSTAQVGRHGAEGHANSLLAARDGGLIAVNTLGVRDIGPSTDPAFRGWASVPRPREMPIARFHSLSSDGRWCVARLSQPASPSLLDLDSDAAKAALHHPAPEHDRVRLTAQFAPTGGRFAVCDGQDVAVYDAELDTESEAEPPPPLRSLNASGTRPEDGDEGGEVERLPKIAKKAPNRQRSRRASAPRPRTVLKPVFVLQRPEGVHPKDHWQPPIAFTHDGRGLLVRRPRNRVQMWDVGSGSQTGEWSWRMDGVTCLAVAPDGLTAVAGARFGRFVVWDLD